MLNLGPVTWEQVKKCFLEENFLDYLRLVSADLPDTVHSRKRDPYRIEIQPIFISTRVRELAWERW